MNSKKQKTRQLAGQADETLAAHPCDILVARVARMERSVRQHLDRRVPVLLRDAAPNLLRSIAATIAADNDAGTIDLARFDVALDVFKSWHPVTASAIWDRGTIQLLCHCFFFLGLLTEPFLACSRSKER